MTITDFLNRLNGVRSRAQGKWSSRCPSHADKSPSLSIRKVDGKTLLYCFAGCTPEEIVGALGLKLKDLFTDTPVHPGQRPTPKPQKLDLSAVAFRFEMAALDRRVRADAVLNAVARFSSAAITDVERDRLMNAVARAYADRERAQFFETVADGLRMKAFHKREDLHAA